MVVTEHTKKYKVKVTENIFTGSVACLKPAILCESLCCCLGFIPVTRDKHKDKARGVKLGQAFPVDNSNGFYTHTIATLETWRASCSSHVFWRENWSIFFFIVILIPQLPGLIFGYVRHVFPLILQHFVWENPA